MHEYSSVSFSASDITMASTPCVSSSSNWNRSISSSSEEEETQVKAIVLSEAEEEIDEYTCVQTPTPIITYVEDSLDNEEKDMAPKPGPSLRELMKGTSP